MHCGKRHLPEQKQTEEIPTLIDFMRIKSEGRLNWFLKKRGLGFAKKFQHKK